MESTTLEEQVDVDVILNEKEQQAGNFSRELRNYEIILTKQGRKEKPMSVFICSLLSGLIATSITLYVTIRNNKKEKKYEYKLAIFRELVAYRNDLTGESESSGKFQKAVNEVFIAYNDCPEVLAKFEEFRKSVTKVPRVNGDEIIGNLLQLYKSMVKELKLDCSYSNDDLFTKPIVIKK